MCIRDSCSGALLAKRLTSALNASSGGAPENKSLQEEADLQHVVASSSLSPPASSGIVRRPNGPEAC
eukprot:9188487-Pyramimonas_sp.AAC.1